MRKFFHSFPSRIQTITSSIRFRLTLWFVAILALVLLVFSAFVYTRQARELRGETVSRLENKIQQIQSLDRFAHREPFEGQITIPNISQDAGPILQQDEVLALTDTQGSVVQKYGPITSSDVNQLAQIGIGRASTSPEPFNYTLISAQTAGQNIPQQYIFLVTPITFGPNVIGFLILGSPIDPSGQLARLFITLLLGGVATLGIALAGGYWLANRAMRPVKTITQTARQIGETDLSRRLNLGTKDELGQLADTFDQMLARLQAAFERQRQFTADASHELRTPLTIVNLETSRALAAKRPPQEYKRALRVIQSENEFMTRLVNNLLMLSRMDAGQTVLKMEELDLSDLALDVVERLAPIAKRNDVVLSTGDLPELKLFGDRQYLSQMITNLVENAIKYTQAPEKCVRIETGSRRAGQMDLGWLKVEDNGPGIPEESLPHLFDRFYQVDKARSRDSGNGDNDTKQESDQSGSGLGLSIVQWIVKAHRGDVFVQSEEGKGTTFEITLPLMRDEFANP
jgi:signal transduction histidine kinase